MKKSESYSEYKKARDRAWESLIKYHVKELPVDVRSICRQSNVSVLTYKKDIEFIKTYGLEQYIENDGFTSQIKSKYFIFYNDEITPFERTTFTIAHEMGHIALGDVRNSSTVWNRGEQKAPNPSETQANVFASRLLAPACVLKELNIKTVDELQQLTGLSYAAAKIRLERLNMLRERDKFYLSPLERTVRNNFNEFIKKYKG